MQAQCQLVLYTEHKLCCLASNTSAKSKILQNIIIIIILHNIYFVQNSLRNPYNAQYSVEQDTKTRSTYRRPKLSLIN